MNNTNGQNDSDNSSSPAASASSDRDEISSNGSTPPPQDDTGYREPKRDSAYSRSYQSVVSEPAFHHRHWSNASSRPFTADPSIAESYPDEDPQELAAAVGLLSCSYGTPRTGPMGMPSDVPPVPPLPEKYAMPKYRTQEDVIMDGDSSEDDQHHRHAPYSGRMAHDDFDGVFGRMDN